MGPKVVFSSKEAERLAGARHLTLEEPRVRGLVMRLPRFAVGQPVPVILIPGISEEVQGIWSLWQISISSHSVPIVDPRIGVRTLTAGLETRLRRILPLFLADTGKIFMPTARHIWDQFVATNPRIRSFLDPAASRDTFFRLQEAVEEHGKPVYEMLVQEHWTAIARMREKAEYAFAAKRKTIERIGLPQVRKHRMRLLEEEERGLQKELNQKAHVYPEMVPLLLVRVEGSGHE